MGFFNRKPAVSGVAAFLQTEERLAAGLHEDFDTAMAAVGRVKTKARNRASELSELSLTASRCAEYLYETFGE